MRALQRQQRWAMLRAGLFHSMATHLPARPRTQRTGALPRRRAAQAHETSVADTGQGGKPRLPIDVRRARVASYERSRCGVPGRWTGPGGPRGLQNRCTAACAVVGGFDSHTPLPGIHAAGARTRPCPSTRASADNIRPTSMATSVGFLQMITNAPPEVDLIKDNVNSRKRA